MKYFLFRTLSDTTCLFTANLSEYRMRGLVSQAGGWSILMLQRQANLQEEEPQTLTMVSQLQLMWEWECQMWHYVLHCFDPVSSQFDDFCIVYFSLFFPDDIEFLLLIFIMWPACGSANSECVACSGSAYDQHFVSCPILMRSRILLQ